MDDRRDHDADAGAGAAHAVEYETPDASGRRVRAPAIIPTSKTEPGTRIDLDAVVVREPPHQLAADLRQSSEAHLFAVTFTPLWQGEHALADRHRGHWAREQDFR